MDSFLPSQPKQTSSTMDSPPSAAAAAAPPPAGQASTISESPTQAHIQMMSEVDPSALITPIKPNEEHLRITKKKQLQLQLAIVNDPSTTTKKPKKTHEVAVAAKALKWPPVSSVKSLPPLAGRMADLARGDKKRNTIEFEVNQECTSIALVPSGHLAVAGFTDGTLRLFDLTGTFIRDKNDPRNPATDSGLFDDDASSSEEEMEMVSNKGKRGSNEEVCSRMNQRFGVVACQIHARGVHTSLLMDVAVSEDGLFAFGGVLRGSVELAAVYLGDAEDYLSDRMASNKVDNSDVGLLDLVRVDRHADAKLKGFGAVARLWNGWERTRAGERPEYLLFTGKGIKNIHIWSFKPSRFENGEEQKSVWTCLYDTQTNGTSISQLYFRHNPNGLQGISKSDDQKLRVWDLSWEQKRVAEGSDGSDRPKRPNYVDVASTETTVGVCGSYAFALSAASEAIINLIPLDAEDVSSPFNLTELALPMSDADVGHAMASRPSRSGRQQRGELKSVVNVCGLVFDASHALLNLSDGSMVHYSHDESGHPILVPCSPALSKTSIDSDATLAFHNKQICLAKVGAEGKVVMAVSSYNEPVGRGALMFRTLPVNNFDAQASKSRRFWGFNGLRRKRNKATVSLIARKKPEPETRSAPSPTTDDVTTLQHTPMPGAKVDDRKPAATTVLPTPAASILKASRKKPEVDNMVAPSPILAKPLQWSVPSKPDTAKKTKPPPATDDMNTPTTLRATPNCDRSPVKLGAKPRARLAESEAMDTQLESLVHQSSKAAANTPAKHAEKDLLEPAQKKQKAVAGSEPSSRRSSTETSDAGTPTRKSTRKSRSSPKKSAPKDSHKSQAQLTPAAPTNENQLFHLGITVFDRKQEPDLPEACYHPKMRAKLLFEKLGDETAAKNVSFDVPQSSLKKSTPPNTILIAQDEDRRKLAARHRAEHEMIRRQVLSTIRYVISTWDVEANSNKSYSSVVDSTKKWFNDALADHQETLNGMMERQVLEAESLAARQTLQLKKRAPMLSVSFPFPEVFEQARRELFSHFGFKTE